MEHRIIAALREVRRPQHVYTLCRWWIARAFDRLGPRCWASLALWAWGRGDFPDRSSGQHCQYDADRDLHGRCFCGKYLAANRGEKQP